MNTHRLLVCALLLASACAAPTTAAPGPSPADANATPRRSAGAASPASSAGRLAPDRIQAVVRRNYGRFRMCYELGLHGCPNLEGRITIRFVIGRDGRVTHVANGGSDVSDPEVVACVLSAVRGIVFPKPQGGPVTVVYPIMFSPG
jgi:hypothetical protein